MTTDDSHIRKHRLKEDNDISTRSSAWPGRIFSVPPAVERLFDHFPLLKYDENSLPIRAPKARNEHVLYVFATESGAKQGRPSFNPTCLKWQTYLKFSGVAFRIAPSSNHASPSGALPFLLPARQFTETSKSKDPVPTKMMRKWLGLQNNAAKQGEPSDSRCEAYVSLLDNCIRKAWLYQLYLSPANRPIVRRLYADPCSSNALVRITIERQLHQAAASEIVNASTSNTIIEEEAMREAGEALHALSSLLAEDDWFFGQTEPGLFDASVFAYTHLIQDEELKWPENQLLSLLQRHENLLQHRLRIADMYY